MSKLSHSLNVIVNDEPFEVFMSFSLLNRICFLMGDSAQIPLILQDAELREAVLIEALAVRDKKGKVVTRRGIDEISVSFEDIQNILEFASEHVADFTLGAVERSNKLMAAHFERIQGLQKQAAQSSSPATPTGPEDSPSKSPAASPSA